MFNGLIDNVVDWLWRLPAKVPLETSTPTLAALPPRTATQAMVDAIAAPVLTTRQARRKAQRRARRIQRKHK